MIKHLLSVSQLSREEVTRILDTAESFREVGTRVIKKVPALRGRTVVNLFYENSTRTRISFELAAKRLSADVINFSTGGSSVSKGESLHDTIKTIACYSDAIVLRHPNLGAAREAAAASDALRSSMHRPVPIINAAASSGTSLRVIRASRSCGTLPKRTSLRSPSISCQPSVRSAATRACWLRRSARRCATHHDGAPARNP